MNENDFLLDVDPPEHAQLDQNEKTEAGRIKGSTEDRVHREKKEEYKKINIHDLVEIIFKQCSNWRKIDNGVQNLSKCENLENNKALRSFKKNNFSTPEEINKFKYSIIAELLQEKKEKLGKSDLLFLASIQVDLNELKNLISNCQDINETKSTESVLIFTLRYGNIYAKDFLECIEILLEAGVDVKKYNKYAMTAIDYVADLYKKKKHNPSVKKALEEIANLLIAKGIYQNENQKTIDFLNEININTCNYVEMDEKTKLFYYIVKKDVQKVQELHNIERYLNCDTDEYTLLQLACERRCQPEIVSYLLKKGADPNMTTPFNSRTPLELTARDRKGKRLFKIILSNKKTEVNQQQYNNFLEWRSKSMMPLKLFELLLESNKVNPHFKSDTGNNPLFYAVNFSHKKAIQNLLKRGASLTEKNKDNKCVLDIIDPTDLENYFDSCLILDDYQSDPGHPGTKIELGLSHPEYKVELRFRGLYDETDEKESVLISEIGNRCQLEHLLTHPLVHIFILLKWHRIEPCFWIIFVIQLILYLLLSCLFYHLPDDLPLGLTIICTICVLLNIVLKVPIFLYHWYKNQFRKLKVIDRCPLHFFVELVLIIILIGSFFQKQIRAFAFITIIISFLLTIGYHPKLSKWSIMLQKIFKTFLILFVFFSFVILAFSAGFHIIFENKKKFNNFVAAVSYTVIMTTGEFNIDDDFDFEGIGGHLIYLLFIMSIYIVIVNFWIGVAVSDIERIESRSVINAFQNVIIFMFFIELSYCSPLFKFFNIREPFLFSHNKSKLNINFFVNKENQFKFVNKKRTHQTVNKENELEKERPFPKKVDSECLDKIKNYYRKVKLNAQQNENEKILNKLEDILKKNSELKENFAED